MHIIPGWLEVRTTLHNPYPAILANQGTCVQIPNFNQLRIISLLAAVTSIGYSTVAIALALHTGRKVCTRCTRLPPTPASKKPPQSFASITSTVIRRRTALSNDRHSSHFHSSHSFSNWPPSTPAPTPNDCLDVGLWTRSAKSLDLQPCMLKRGFRGTRTLVGCRVQELI